MGLTRGSTGRGAEDTGLNLRRRRESDLMVALAGNPNVGKSSVFNALTGSRQHTGNWPGKTVCSAQGRCETAARGYILVDLPGCYSLAARSPEEEVARDFIRSGQVDAVCVVCDATCLERNLILALQVMETGVPTLLCVNLMDEARRKGIRVDVPLLSEKLGVPAVGVSAHKRATLSALTHALDALPESAPLPAGEDSGDVSALVRRAEALAGEVVSRNGQHREDRDRRIDAVLTGRVGAWPAMLALLALVFYLTLTGANYPSALLSRVLFGLQDTLMNWANAMGMPAFLSGALILGVYRTLAWVVSVMLPPMAIFFPLFTLLEDAGFLPRVAYDLDSAFHRCSACGKQALTMCMGFGCNAAGVSGCRIIDSPREKLIAILTNSFVPCNGRFPTLIAVISMFFAPDGGTFFAALILTGVILLGIAMTFAASKLLSATVLRGEASSFTLELPPYRMPQIGRVLVRSVFDRTLFVLGRAVVVAAPAGLLIYLIGNITVGGTSLLSLCAGALDPFARLLGLDGVILMAFLLGFPANEIVVPILLMAYLSGGSLVDTPALSELHTLLLGCGWSWRTAACMLIFCLFHWPCSTTLLTIRRETGSAKWTALAFLLPTVIGMLLCFLFAQLTALL
jgi:ferrous iron transport protein B